MLRFIRLLGIRKILLITGSSILLFSAIPAHSAEIIDSICAVVDEEIILESDISYGISTLLLENGLRYPTREQVQQFRSQVLEAYITQKILLAQAIEDTLQVEPRTVDKELQRKLDALIAQVGSEQKLVDYFGHPLRQIMREMRKGVRDGMLVEMLKQHKLADIYVRRGEVIDFYRTYNDSLPRMPERVELSHILLEVQPSEEAYQKAQDRIENIFDLLVQGADFDSVAMHHSEDPSATQGGHLGFTNRGDLVPEYEEVAFNLEPGEISGVVESRFGFHIIRLVERQGERISTQHILVKLAPTRDDWDRIKQAGLDIREKVVAGGDFAKFATEYSADLESASNGGKLDIVPLEELADEFRYVVDELDPGEISEPFETLFGIHLLLLHQRHVDRGLSLSEDWQAIERMAVSFKQDRIFQEWVVSLKDGHYIWTGE